MEVKLSTEGYEILSSGSVIVPANEYVQFEIEGLKFRILFVQESEDENAPVQISKTVETNQNGQDCLTILISNLQKAFFSSTRQSMQVATIGDRALSVRFSIVSVNRIEELGSEDKLLFYTWYLANDTTQNE